jgi:hypothetical protein
MTQTAFRSVSRRRFLRGLGGISLGLPYLEALAPRGAAASEAPALQRFGVFFACNGVDMTRWFPKGTYGALTDAHFVGTANEALIPFRRKLLIPRGIHMAPRSGGRDPGGGDDHGRCMAHKLTGYTADPNGLAQGRSIDYILADAINPGIEGARRPPLNLWVGKPGNYKSLDYISYSAPGRAVAGITTRGMPTRAWWAWMAGLPNRRKRVSACCTDARACSTWFRDASSSCTVCR